MAANRRVWPSVESVGQRASDGEGNEKISRDDNVGRHRAASGEIDARGGRPVGGISAEPQNRQEMSQRYLLNRIWADLGYHPSQMKMLFE
ncbi:unnamed protein product, partial [Nesidiocoris tenuis]